MRTHPVSYRGAGLAITTRDAKGTTRVLLGRRLHHPGRHWWSFPGGGWNGSETRPQNALREAREEVGLWNPSLDWPPENTLVEVWRSHLYDWTTFSWHVENPSLQMPKQVHDIEFDAWGWFPLNHLPFPLNYGVRPVAKRLTKERR